MSELTSMGVLSKFKDRLGINRTIFYTILARGIQAAGGVASIFLIARHLTQVEQGYYYTFGSIVAMQIFFELGLNGIITQFAAHEIAHLEWDGHHLKGEIKHASRLSSLLHFYIRWFSFISVGVFLILLGVGFYFFHHFGKGNDVNWMTPWILLSLSTALMFLVDPLLAYLEGLGKVREVARTRFFQQCGYICTLFIVLMLGGKLYATAIASLVAFSVIAITTFLSPARTLLVNVWNYKVRDWGIDYKREIFPYQWRIAVSWISGYFIFQMFNPVLFATDGPVVAGQMGMTLAALNGINSLSMSWLSTKVPLFSGLIATKKYTELDHVFNRTVRQASFISFASLLIFACCVVLFRFAGLPIGNRFLPLVPLVLMCIATFSNQLVGALAIYLRCHKKEPLLTQSVVLAIATTLSTLGLGHLYGVTGIVSGYCLLVVFGSLGWVSLIFKRKKALWHY